MFSMAAHAGFSGVALEFCPLAGSCCHGCGGEDTNAQPTFMCFDCYSEVFLCEGCYHKGFICVTRTTTVQRKNPREAPPQCAYNEGTALA